MSEIILEVIRGNLVENIHRGDIAIVGHNNKEITGIGNPGKITYWRSSAKPFQVLPVILSGAAEKYNFTDKELAVMSASHSGQRLHIELVNSILKKINLKKEALKCGTHPPFHKPTRKDLQKRGEKPKKIHNACSGKHAAQLALCQYYDWDLENYFEADHPVQKKIIKVISEVTEYPLNKIEIGVDGCGVPVFGMPLKNMALAYYYLIDRKSMPSKYREASTQIFEAIINNPEVVAGTNRFDTDLMKATNKKIIAKAGADGVFCLGIKDKGGISLKIEDGDMKSIFPVIVELLSKLNILSEEELKELSYYHKPVVKDHRGEIVGKYVPRINI